MWSMPGVRRQVLGLVLVGTLGIGAVACGSSSPKSVKAKATTLKGGQQTPPPQVGQYALPDASAGGAALPMKAQPGGLLVVYFGYTNCPDICPGTLAGIRLALHKIGAQADKVQVAMVTVDPTRDTGAVLTEYLGHFFKANAHALRTEDPGLLQQVAGAFGVQYEIARNAKGEEEVGHSSLSFAVDDQGRIVDAWPYGFSEKDIASDMKLLLSREARTS
jgi:cytochrome oxidase Cu insertion factor (SCO1/SenC/PrrC family)